MVRDVKGEKNKHYSKTETGECYCDALKDAMAVVNKQIYLLIKGNIYTFFFYFGEGKCFLLRKHFYMNPVFQKWSSMI